MKKIIIASVIVLASGVTAWSVNKPKATDHTTIDAKTIKADVATQSTSGIQEDIGTIQ